jgi:hypothetical protein
MEKDREFHPDPKCPAWQKAVLNFLEKVDASNEKGG